MQDIAVLTRCADGTRHREGGDYHFNYDALGRRTGASYPNGMTLAQAYDHASRIESMVYRKPDGAVIESFGYRYDTLGNRTAKLFADGSVEQYGYDTLSRLTTAGYGSSREVHYSYDAVGNRTTSVGNIVRPGPAGRRGMEAAMDP